MIAAIMLVGTIGVLLLILAGFCMGLPKEEDESENNGKRAFSTFIALLGVVLIIFSLMLAVAQGRISYFDQFDSTLTTDKLLDLGDQNYSVIKRETVDSNTVVLVRSANEKLYLVKTELYLQDEFAVFTYPGEEPQILPSKNGKVIMEIPVSPQPEEEADDAAAAHPPTADSPVGGKMIYITPPPVSPTAYGESLGSPF